jgi:aryl-alcohol dehydrogenase-like predicted oxidoreductase
MSDSYGEFPERWWKVLSEVETIADEVDGTPAQVAIKWVSRINGLTSVPIIGSTSVNQLNETLKYVDLSLSEDQHQRISDAGNLDDLNPHAYTYT